MIRFGARICSTELASESAMNVVKAAWWPRRMGRTRRSHGRDLSGSSLPEGRRYREVTPTG